MEFLSLLDDHCLTQIVTKPTRNQNTLDLIATNLDDQVVRVKTLPRICDHDIPYTEFRVKVWKKYQVTLRINLYKKADWDGVTKHLTPIMDCIDRAYHPSIEELWTEIRDSLHDAAVVYTTEDS